MNALLSIFSNPWILVWLPVAAVPVLLHLWNRRQYREAPWAAMEYLLAAIEKNSRRVRIEQLLLLLIRTAVVLLVVFALAKPFIGSVAARFASGQRQHQVFVLDASYSMQYTSADRSLLDVAKERIAQLVDESGQGDGFSLVVMADAPQVVVGKAVFDKSSFRDEVAQVMPIDGGANLTAALAAVENVIVEAKREQPQLTAHSVTIFTDLQRTTWEPAAESAADDDAAESRPVDGQLAKLRAHGPVEIVPLGTSGADNLAVTQLAIAEPFATIRQPVQIQATVHNYGGQPRSRQLVELMVNDRRVDQQFVDIPAGESSPPILFQYRFDAPGEHAVAIAVAADSLEVDNHRYLSVPVKAYLNALLVSGKRGEAEPLAFSLETDFELDSRLIRPQVVAESALLELDLRGYDCIFLMNVAQFTAAEAQVLDAYLREGGGLIFFLGDQVIAERYNEMLAGDGPDAPRVLPARLQAAKTTEPMAFDPLEYRHPLLAAWKDQPDAGLLSARTWRYFPLSPLAGDEERELPAARVALKFSNGDPAIVEAPIHRGRSIVVATAASPESMIDQESRRFWSDLFRAELITPWGQELWRFAVGSRQQQRNVAVGDAFGGTLPTGAVDARVEVFGPNSDGDEAASRRASVDISRWSFDDTSRAGFYRAEFESRPSEELFAVNVNPSEGNLSRIDPRDLPAGFTAISDEAEATGEPVERSSAAAPAPLHKWLLLSVLLLLCTESLYAWWLGSRAS